MHLYGALRRPVIVTTRRRGRKTRRAPGYDLRRPLASPSPCLFPSPLVPSSSAPHSVTPLPLYRPTSSPCIYDTPHPASSTPTASNKPHLSSCTSGMTPRSSGTTLTHPSRPPFSTYPTPPPP